ncbi:MAG: DUF4397 domain-containing protein [Rhodothermales bacterium]
MNVFAHAYYSLILCAVLTATLTGCDSTDADEMPAFVRVIHAASGTNAVDFFIDFNLLARNLSFRNASPYVQWEPGLRRLEVRTTQGGQDVSVTRDELLNEDVSYSIVVAGIDDASSIVLLEDDRSAPSTGQARLLVVHAATNTEALNIFATDESGDTALDVSNLRFSETTVPINVAPGTLTFSVNPGGTAPFAQAIEAGRRYLVVVTNSVLFAVIDG